MVGASFRWSENYVSFSFGKIFARNGIVTDFTLERHSFSSDSFKWSYAKR